MNHLLRSLNTPLFFAGSISVVVNLLMLVSPIFMMQVFDRVLMSAHHETLYGLTMLAISALVILGVLDALRQMVLARAGNWLEQHASGRLIDSTLLDGQPVSQAFQHISAVKGFFCAQSVFALLDAPWLFVFAALLWWMHPWLGLVALGGASALLVITVLTELLSRRPLRDARTHQNENEAVLASALGNADAVRAMGMALSLRERWQASADLVQINLAKAAERSAMLSGAAKGIRLVVQTLVLAAGAYLVLAGDLSAGGMIAASILLGRCLAPAEQAIGAWKSFVQARDGWAALSRLRDLESAEQSMRLPDPTGSVAVAHLHYQAVADGPKILDDISLRLRPGEVLCLVGRSGSGKTTLSRLIVGALEPTGGEVRIDERNVLGWNPDDLGRNIGYLPQSVGLLPGTIKDNIQRFGADDPEGVIAAARGAGVDQMIRRLEKGYETEVRADDPYSLSGGQLQRIGLARALYGEPSIIVLDEPNSNLDLEGEQALSKAVRAAADRGAAVMVISHRPALLQIADRVAILAEGRIVAEVPREEILTHERRDEAIEKASITPSNDDAQEARYVQ